MQRNPLEKQVTHALLWAILICAVYIYIVSPLLKDSLQIKPIPLDLSLEPLQSLRLSSNKPKSSIKLSSYWAQPAGRGDKFAGGKFLGGSPWELSSSTGGSGSAPHQGQDIPMPTGTPLYAVGTPGETVTITCKSGGGGGITLYNTAPSLGNVVLVGAHLSQCYSGSYTAGQVVAYSGNTGNSTNPHLHFAQKVNGQFVPPQRWGIEAMLTGKIPH